MLTNLGFIYLIIINLLGTSLLCTDKKAAVKMSYRISEKRLHLLEFLGGILTMLPAMYIIQHKTNKFQYYFWSYLFFSIWGVLLCYFGLFYKA